MRPHAHLLACLAGLSFAWAAPVSAETLAELDALSDVAAEEASGIAAAREQAGRGEYLEALATLERVLAVHPKSRDARLIHAIYLCEIDDRRGGLVEIDKLKEKHYGKELLAEARARCAGGAGG
jgi:uncharacterized protein HemY